MEYLLFLYRHLRKAWHILLPAAFGIIHFALAFNTSINLSPTNKFISMSFQIIGGALVLWTIDANIGIVNNQSLKAMLLSWVKGFSHFRRSYVLKVNSIEQIMTMSSPKLKTFGPANTVEEKIKYLQQQIDWLKEDLDDETKHIKSLISGVEKRTEEKLYGIDRKVAETDRKVSEISVGGFKVQIFGLLLMVHGTVAGFFS